MSGISGMFNTGRLALFANQKGLEVTSQNIANVSTPGYTRQEVVLSATRPIDIQPGQIGTGVEVSEIRRVVNTFMENQITAQESSYGQAKAEGGLLSRVELSFTDADGTGLNLALSDFFSALQALSTNPGDRPARSALLEQAKALSRQFVDMDGQLEQVQVDANKEIIGVVAEINQFASQVADLNLRIKQVELSGQNPNDLRDQRQVLINQISERVEIKTIEDNFGQVTVFVGAGKALVEGNLAASLVGIADLDNNGFVNISFDPGSGSTTNITSSITDGRLKGLIDVRDTDVAGYRNELDQLAAALVNEFNQQHTASGVAYDLNGNAGVNFFRPLSPTFSVLSSNTGSGTPVGTTVTVSDASALTFDDYDLSFSGGKYTLTNRNTAAASTAGTLPVVFEGITISAVGGTPVNGDTFRITTHKGSAQFMSVVITDPDLIAISGTAAGIPGDNTNANLLAAIQDKAIGGLDGDTLQTFYGGLVGGVGTRTQSAQRTLTVETGMRSQLENMRLETSGVSLDEELTNIIKFQRAYQAAARVITTADEMFETILALKR